MAGIQQNKKLLDPINETQEQDPGNFKIKVSIDNIIGWDEKYLFMEEEIEQKNYKY